jgi:hypothetical protein
MASREHSRLVIATLDDNRKQDFMRDIVPPPQN